MTSLLEGRPLTVLHAVPHLDRVGGCERQALLLARHQSRTGLVRPVLLTHEAPGLWAAGAPHAREAAGGPAIHRLARGLRRYHPGAWWRQHGRGVGLVHAHAVHKLCGQLVALAARDGVPSLVKVATPADIELFAEPRRWQQLVEPEQDPARFGPRWRWMAAATWRRLSAAEAFLALNDDIAARLAARGLRAERVRNAVDCARFAPPGPEGRAAARAALAVPAGAPCLASVGRLVARKDLACVLAALARLPRARLLVCGGGPQSGELARLARQLRVDDRVHWLGERDDVRPALHAADVFVHASRSEGFPNALLEALACGLPAALSDIPGHRDGEALPGRAALLFPPGDDAALAAALGRLLDDPREREARGAAAREVARRTYGVDVVAAQMAQLYERHRRARPTPAA